MFPTAVWDGSSDDEAASNRRKPTGHDWRRLSLEVEAVQRVLDGFGVSTAGAFGTSNPSKAGQVYKNASSGVNEVQNLAEINASAGTWTLTITLPGNDAVTTAAVAFDVDDEALEAAIDTALDGVEVNGVAFEAGDIAVTGTDINASGGLDLTFSGACVAGLNVALVVANQVDLTGGAAAPPVESTTTSGVLDNRLILSGAGTATYPNVWDGESDTRPDAEVVRQPDYQDWSKMVLQIKNLQRRVQPLGLSATGTIPAFSDGGLFQNNADVTLSSGVVTLDIWDGTSASRTDPDVQREPDWQDFNVLRGHLKDMQSRLVPLGFDSIGALPTSDPAVAGKLWTSTGVVKVSQ